MRTFEAPYIADWFVISLRWVIVVGLLIALAFGGQFSAGPLAPLLALSLWNVGMTVLAALNTRMTLQRQISLAVDVLLAGAFFWLQGGLTGAAFWAALLPILTGAIYYEMPGALLAALMLSLMEGANTILRLPMPEGLVIIVVVVVGTLSIGLIFGFLGRRLIAHLRRMRLEQLEREERKRRVENERIRAIYELTSMLSATLSYKRVLDSALDMGYAALNPDTEDAADERLVSAVLLFRGDQLRIGSARRFTNADLRVNLTGNEGILKRVFEEGEPVLTNSVGFDPELGRIIALRACTSAYCFPLRSGFNVYGALLFAHPDPHYFTRDRLEMLEIIGRQSVIAIQNARLYQDLIEEKERMVEVHEEARKKLARDLHDGPTQSVAAMAMRINLARRLLEKDAGSAGKELLKVEELAQRTSKEIRHMLFTLRPLILESQGLTAALQSMAEKMRETYSQNMLINVDERAIENMDMGKQGVIFYIIEEAVNNARKHANAATIWVRLKSLEPGLALLEIQDDGIGFDVDEVVRAYDQRGSLGMINLRERTELVSGLLNIDSAPGKGTLIQVYIPLTEEAADRLHHAKK